MTQVNNNNNAAAEAARKAAEEAARKAAEEAAKKAQEAAAKKAQEEAAAAQREEASNRASEQQQTQQSQRATSFQNDGTRPQLATNRTTDDLRAQQLSQQLDNQQAQTASPQAQAPRSPTQTQTNQSLTQPQSPPSQTSSRRAEAAQARRAARAQLLRGTSDTTQTSTQNVETLQSPTQQEVAPTSQETPSTSLTGAPSTLRTEDREDANINCVDRAHEMIQGLSPEERENTDVMFMRDPSNPDGNDAGHIMVRGDNGLLRDPNNPEAPGRTLEDIQADGRYEPVLQDGQPYTMPAEEFDQLMSTPPEQRDLSGIPQEVTEMRLADAPAEAATAGVELLEGDTPVTVDGLRDTITALANEPGEGGRIRFGAEVEGRILGVLEAGGTFDASIGVSHTDTGAISLSMDTRLAANLGLDVSAFGVSAEAGVEAGVARRLSARFANPEDASQWLHQRLATLNESAEDTIGEPLLNMAPADSYQLSRPPTYVREGRTDVGAYAEIEADLPLGLEIEGELRATYTTGRQTYTRPGEDGELQQVGLGTTTEATFEGEARINGQRLQVAYTNTTVQGDPVGDNNGQYRNLQISATFNPGAAQGDLSRTVAATMGLRQPPVEGDPQYAEYQEGLSAVERALAGAGTGPVTLTFEQNRVLEEGEYNTQYSRWSLTTGVSRRGEFDTRIGEAEVRFSATQTEVIAETIGEQTETYVRQLATRAQEGDWQRFTAENQEALERMFPGQDIEQLRTAWNQEAGVQAQFQADVGRAVDDIIAAQPGFLRFSGERREAAGERLQAMDPEQLAGVLDELASRGYSDFQIRQHTNLTSGREFDALLERAAPHRQYGDNFTRNRAVRLLNAVGDGTDPDFSFNLMSDMQISLNSDARYPDGPGAARIQQFIGQIEAGGITRAQALQWSQSDNSRVSEFFTDLLTHWN